MGSDPGQKRCKCNRNWAIATITAVLVLFGGPVGAAKLFGAERVGAAGATFILRALGDPCDGVDHPAYQSDARGAIVDAVQVHEGVETSEIYLVEKVAKKDGWAYIETAPWHGPGSGDPHAYILRAEDATWTFAWEGGTGAQPGAGEEGNPYPDDFDFTDQDMLMCQTLCASDNEQT